MTKKAIGITLMLIGFIGAGWIIVRSTLYAPDTDLPTSTVGVGDITSPNIPNTAEDVPSTSLPVRLSIPKIGVNAGVQYVGVKDNGQMANPSNFTDVAWYKSGTVPGEVGSAVIAGHVDNALALSGVFKNLKNLKPGDDVYVSRKDGVRLHFKVDRVEYYNYLKAPNVEIFAGTDDEAQLNLVTCAGTWIKSAKSYSERLVVYTTLVE